MDSKKNKNIININMTNHSELGEYHNKKGKECGKEEIPISGTGFFILMGVLAGVLVAFHVDIPVDQGAPAVSNKLCKTDKDCLRFRVLLSDDIIEDESERAKEYHGQCLQPTEIIRHCKKAQIAPKGMYVPLITKTLRYVRNNQLWKKHHQ